MQRILKRLEKQTSRLAFGPPITCVYNPLTYARSAHLTFWRRYGLPPKQVLLVGMNPGPWGMAQTGVPFGDVEKVSRWLNIHDPVDIPARQHPKRPILGFNCRRGEVSGRRLWGWAESRFQTPERFFKRFGVINYCPLVFMEVSGRNRTPDKLPAKEKDPLLRLCDEALLALVRIIQPQYVVGVGKFAANRAEHCLSGLNLTVGAISHPSPANPKANAGWVELAEQE
ncbi:MAG: single-stranded DNA-binding protein, partial [Desulfatitalea sp.]|nr:single-stranded DNA-binding protein [Desulfatitalea sp.]